MTQEKLTKDERSLLLYLETRAVDYGGKVDLRHMNIDDLEIARKWNESGFVVFRRIPFKDIKIKGNTPHSPQVTQWAALSDDAWDLAHAARRAKAERTKAYSATKEPSDK